MRPVSVSIVGIPYPNKKGPGRLFEAGICKPGEPLQLILEPNNKHDEHAVAVFSMRDVQLGYIASERAVWLGMQIRRGVTVKAVFQALAGNIAWARVAFDGTEPTLPEQSESNGGEEPGADGFWPDEIYDE